MSGSDTEMEGALLMIQKLHSQKTISDDLRDALKGKNHNLTI